MHIHDYEPQWTLADESREFQDLSVTEAIDGLLLKIVNSNGLEFCSFAQVAALRNILMDRYTMVLPPDHPGNQ